MTSLSSPVKRRSTNTSHERLPVMRREIKHQVESYMTDVEPQILSRARDISRRVRPPMSESYQGNMAQGSVVGEVGDVPPGDDATAVGSGDLSSAASLPSAFQVQETRSANVSLQPFPGHTFAGTFMPEYHDSRTAATQQGTLGSSFPTNVKDWEFLGDPSSEGPGHNFDTL